jgi:RNA polymerase sigma-70 factor (ECF subfamily)
MTSIEQLYHEHHQPLRRYLERLVDDRTTAEDLCHESFVKALQHWDDRDQTGSARGWLYHIVTNTAYDHLRRQRRVAMTPLTDEHEAIAGAAALESQFADAEPVRAALNHLPEHYRVPLLLQLEAGYMLHTIAAMLGCNVNTIKTHLHRARLRFRQLYVAAEEANVREEAPLGACRAAIDLSISYHAENLSHPHFLQRAKVSGLQ